jgi:hypothetical protein
MNYTVRAVYTRDYYQTKEGNDTLVQSRRDDVNDIAVSRRHSKGNTCDSLKVRT